MSQIASISDLDSFKSSPTMLFFYKFVERLHDEKK